MYRFKLTLKHDNGVIHITTTASSKRAAIAQVMAHELCPRSAIKQVVTLAKLF